MDAALKEAAMKGDVKFLREAFSTQPLEYFLTQAPEPEDNDEDIGGNILHLAAWKDKVEFIKEAVNLLPLDLQKQLLFQASHEYKWIPLHAAAVTSSVSYEIVIIFKQIYASLSLSYKATDNDKDSVVKPWLALTTKDRTPLHMALKDDVDNDKCAMEILEMDPEFESCSIVDDEGNTPLHYALKNAFYAVAEMILMSSLSSSSVFVSEDAFTPFNYVSHLSDDVIRFMFKNHGEWLDKIDEKGFSILNQWATDGEARPCKLLLEGGSDLAETRTKIFRQKVFEKEKKSDTPLHIAARKKDCELGQIFVRGYQQQVSGDEGENQEIAVVVECPPWRVKTISGNTALHSALYPASKHEELALDILSIEPTMCKIYNNKGESPFFLAVWSGCAKAVNEIMKIEEPHFQMLRRNDGTTLFHCLSACSEKTGRMLLEKYWWMINMRNDLGKTALDHAKTANTLWLINLLNNPSLIQKEEFDWIGACKREETAAVLAFIDSCQDLQKVCRQENDTPLHHIKLPTYKEYANFLKIPAIAELKNTTDHDGATALHRALERKDMCFGKILPGYVMVCGL